MSIGCIGFVIRGNLYSVFPTAALLGIHANALRLQTIIIDIRETANFV